MKNTKKITTLITLIGLIAGSSMAFSASTRGWNDCPKGKHCSTPQCRLYTDTNKNRLCDHGEKQPSSVTTSGISINSQANSGISGCCACTGCGACGKV